MRVLHVVGARPNFMKAAPVIKALTGREGTRQILVHTGQHYDAGMSDIFFEQLDLPRPDINLEVGSGTHARQIGEVMIRVEPVLLDYRPDWVLVYGDVNSTLAAALVCAKLGTRVAHVEAGLRSGDRTMPEEINRIVTDQLADLLFTPSADADENLLREGVAVGKIHLVGNVMIDTLVRLLPKAIDKRADTPPKRYALVTLHRPSNVDDPGMLRELLDSLVKISRDLVVIFPVHPRTRQRISGFGLSIPDNDRLRLLEPMPYLQFLSLQRRATVVITDSGGIQEETTYLGVPCLTVRENTERPVTVEVGTNVLVGRDMNRLKEEVVRVLDGLAKRGAVPPLWDGNAAKRIAEALGKWQT